jgi:hypothetical protein
MKTLIKLLKSFLNIWLWVILILLVLVWIWILIWWMPWMWFEVPWNKLTETYFITWNYKIWKQKFQYNICHNKKWCINWKILWFKEIESNIYIYIKVNYWIISLWDWIKSYDYELYKTNYSDIIDIDNLNDLPKYWYLSNDELIFYSENDLKNLSEVQQKIFKDLEETPTIIIDWIDYTKK